MSESDEKGYCIREVIAHGRRAIAAGFMPDDHVHACPVCYERRICRDTDCPINVHENGEPYGDVVECDACSPPVPSTESLLGAALARAEMVDVWQTLARKILEARVARAEVAERERDEARAKASEVPGLTGALDEARWERDVVLGREPAAGQALAEIARLVRERDAARAELAKLAENLRRERDLAGAMGAMR